MKLAIAGKGGVGKSTLAAALAMLVAEDGSRVLAVDADPDSNLASALGIPADEQRKIIPIAMQAALIEERTGAKADQYGQIFKLNPEVSDIAEKYAYMHRGVALLVLGAASRGGGGCACPENVLLRALVTDLVLFKDDTLIMDMEAGIEHLGRATARGVDRMLVVTEPGRRSLNSAERIIRMAGEIGIKDIRIISNKVKGPDDEEYIKSAFPNHRVMISIPYLEELRRADRDGLPVLEGIDGELKEGLRGVLKELSQY